VDLGVWNAGYQDRYRGGRGASARFLSNPAKTSVMVTRARLSKPKMEIPVTATKVGKIKPILVQIDDAIAEGQAIAIVEI
jgi:hypothetical protein